MGLESKVDAKAVQIDVHRIQRSKSALCQYYRACSSDG